MKRIIAGLLLILCFILQFLHLAAAITSREYLGEQTYVDYVIVLASLSLACYLIIFINNVCRYPYKKFNFYVLVLVVAMQFVIPSIFAVMLEYIEDKARSRIYRNTIYYTFMTVEEQDTLVALTTAAIVVGFVVSFGVTVGLFVWAMIEGIPEDPHFYY